MVLDAIPCFLCSATLFWMVYFGKYLEFVTPRMKCYLYFASMVFFVWGIYEVIMKRKPAYKHGSNHDSLFLSISFLIVLSSLYCDSYKSREFSSAETVAVVSKEVKTAELTGINKEEKQINVTQDNFLSWVNELSNHPKTYDGYSITIEGYAEGQPKDNFYLIQWYMSCCAADVVPVGILCELDGKIPVEETFVRVQGVIRWEQSCEEKVEIDVTRMQKANEPEEKYIY